MKNTAENFVKYLFEEIEDMQVCEVSEDMISGFDENTMDIDDFNLGYDKTTIKLALAEFLELTVQQ